MKQTIREICKDLKNVETEYELEDFLVNELGMCRERIADKEDGA